MPSGDPLPTLQPSDLIFPSSSTSLSSTLSQLTRSNLSLTNRLRSIKFDADFVQSIAHAFQLPLVANERCGSWYIPPEIKAGSAYFKSTDGHFGEWGFSLRRLNLQVLDVVDQSGGYVDRCIVKSEEALMKDCYSRCIIVDSTRRGKSMPDALSKTVPIWIAVMNRLLFLEHSESHGLLTPEDVVSASEHSQIEQRLPTFVDDVRSLNIDVEKLRTKLRKPLRPYWVTPEHILEEHLNAHDQAYCPVVLCTASNRYSIAQHHSTGYVQGAADDAESWALGLDAKAFWAHLDTLLSVPEDELPKMIAEICADCPPVALRDPTAITHSRVWVADNASAEQHYAEFDVVISCSLHQNERIGAAMKHRYIHLACTSGKNGSRQLRSELSKLSSLQQLLHSHSKILVTCHTGKDLAVGVALAIICGFCDDAGIPHLSGDGIMVPGINKTLIKQRLSWIMISMTDASPSRATLQSVNAYLMG
jgi:tRNA A64-2'-O-ribosylphosphate transferase